MAAELQQGKPIMAGYAWTQAINMTADAPPFPVGVELTAHVRKRVADANPLVTLSTGAQTITRVDDNNIALTIPGADSLGWKQGSVFIDVARTDTDPAEYVGFRLEVPVSQPVTRLP